MLIKGPFLRERAIAKSDGKRTLMMKFLDCQDAVKSARKNNIIYHVTGMLLYYKGEFVQLIEGNKEAVKHIYDNFILKDIRHESINLIFEGNIVSRSFTDWSMGFSGDENVGKEVFISTSRLLMNMMSEEAKKNPRTLGVAGMISSYDRIRKSPSR